MIQVASTAAFQPGPYMSVYYASKAYVLSFAEAVGEEVRKKGVTVTALCPGPTRTSFQHRARMEEAPLARGAIPMLTPEKVAEAGYRGLMRGQRVVTPGAMNKLGSVSVRLGPRSLVRRLVGRLNSKR